MKTFQPGQRIVVGNGTVHTVVQMANRIGSEPQRVEVEGGLQWLANDCELAPWQQEAATELAIGQRVRTLIDLNSASWHPEQPDIPAGALGTIEGLHKDPTTGRVWRYGVLLDATVDRLAVSMAPNEIEADTDAKSATTAGDLPQRLADTAAGTWGEEAAIWLLTQHGHWLPELERCGLIHEQPATGWTATVIHGIVGLTSGLIGTPSEWQILDIAMALYRSNTTPLFNVNSLDEQNRRLVLHAIAWAAGSQTWANSLNLTSH